MNAYETKDIRNIAIIAHSGAGKTSMGEAFLFNAKVTDRLCRVDDGNSVLDFEPEEIKRKTTIMSSFHYLKWKKKIINIIDTPGDTNFITETFSSLSIADSAVLLIDAVAGVEVQTDRVWQVAQENNIPTILFINKMDRERADFFSAIKSIEDNLKAKLVIIQIPIGKENNFKGVVDLITQKALLFSKEGSGEITKADLPEELKDEATFYREKLIEAVAESNDTLLEKYLDSGELSDEEVSNGLRNGILKNAFSPVMCGAALLNMGIQPVLDLIAENFPSPQDRPPRKAKNAKTGAEEVLQLTSQGPFYGFVFKTVSDPYTGKLTVLKVSSGVLNSDSTIFNINRNAKEKIGQVLKLEGKSQKPINPAVAGDIVALSKLKETTTNDTLTEGKSDIVFEALKYPTPAIFYAINPKSRGDEDKLSGALARLQEEDPTVQFSRDEQTKEFLISGMGQIHLEVMVEKLKRKFGVEVELKTPKVPYKETIKGKARVQGKYKRQSGGRGQYGDCWLEIEPQPRGKGFEFVDKIVGGAIPRNYIPSIEKGIVETMAQGVIAGYPFVDVKVTVVDGSFHEVDSSDMAFKIAASMGFKKGVVDSNPILLEPIMEMVITVPEECQGDIIGDLNSRRGRVLGMDPKNKNQVIRAQVPMAEILDYDHTLKSITRGRGSFTMILDHYEELPSYLSDKIIAAAKKEKEED
ncbi:MAG: elongation factor G [Thermodesulfobacteriota bacterium]|jgi:elongation factor G|nr:MAG: elongation factor G [Thermodesulfobacteriota bacterium]